MATPPLQRKMDLVVAGLSLVVIIPRAVVAVMFVSFSTTEDAPRTNALGSTLLCRKRKRRRWFGLVDPVLLLPAKVLARVRVRERAKARARKANPEMPLLPQMLLLAAVSPLAARLLPENGATSFS
jgi:hypothetical protein